MNTVTFRKIIVATDGTEASEKAVNTAIEIAKMTGAKLYALHMIAMAFFSMTIDTSEDWGKAFA